MPKYIDIAKALQLKIPVVDVRSPGEFNKGHIPGASNLPLFDNDERAEVGTVYVQQSKEEAVALGYRLVEPKLKWFVSESLKIAGEKKIIVHCWRGGMRSRAFAEHLKANGVDAVYVITGGYKSYRNHVLNFFEQPFKLKVLGGYTGSGKTPALFELKKLGQQVIDLEGLANHKGSAFGAIGQSEQPSVEHFENKLFTEMQELDLAKATWMEDESHNIGMVKLPLALFKQIRSAPLFFLDIPKKERAMHLVADYTQCERKLLEDATMRISKRLGGLNTQNALELIRNGQFTDAAILILDYYDKYYLKGMNRRDPASVRNIKIEKVTPNIIAKKVINITNQNEQNKAHSI